MDKYLGTEWPKTGGISCSFFCWIILSNELCIVPTSLMFHPVHTYSVMCLFISDDDQSIWKQLKNGLVKICSCYPPNFCTNFPHFEPSQNMPLTKNLWKKFRVLKSSLASLSPQKSTSFLTTSAVGIHSGNLFKITTTSK